MSNILQQINDMEKMNDEVMKKQSKWITMQEQIEQLTTLPQKVKTNRLQGLRTENNQIMDGRRLDGIIKRMEKLEGSHRIARETLQASMMSGEYIDANKIIDGVVSIV